MGFYRDRNTGVIYQAGDDGYAPRGRRTFVGEDAILGGDRMLLGADGSGLAQEVALARSTGGYVSADKTVIPTAFYQMLPFSRNYAAGENFTLELKPQRSFRADNLVVTSPEGPFFELNAWLVGQENMFVAQGSVNCAAFSEGAAQRGLDMRGYTANQGALINLGFINMDTEAHRVSGMLTGPAMMKIG